MPRTDAAVSRTHAEHTVNPQLTRTLGLGRPPAGMGRDERQAGEYVVEWQLFPVSSAPEPQPREDSVR